jgi:hypothetical protein
MKENIIKTIKAESKEEHRDALDKKIIALQVLFSYKKYLEWPEDERPLFTDTLNKNTYLLKVLKDKFADSKGLDREDKTVDSYIKEIESEINGIASVNKENSAEDISKILIDVDDKLNKELRSEESSTRANTTGRVPYNVWGTFDANNEAHSNKKENVGLITFNETKEHYLEKYGFDKDDDFLEIHLTENYSKEEEFGLAEMKNEFSKLAEVIIDKYPKTRAVIGTSWIMSHPLMKKIGFNLTDKSAEASLSSWLQFVDKNGQIDVKRFEEAMETGHKPFSSLLGYMPVEEFLNKYLPEDRKGNITLKIINPDKQKENQKLDLELNELRETLRYKLSKNISERILFERLPTLHSVLDKLFLQKDVFKLFQEMSDEEINLIEAQGDSKFKDRLKDIGEKIEAYKNIDKYTDKVVEIK